MAEMGRSPFRSSPPSTAADRLVETLGLIREQEGDAAEAAFAGEVEPFDDIACIMLRWTLPADAPPRGA